ncbi:MAG: ABC transporter permease [Clostridiales bacterium]|nr:ABC transporter permease [Clostridiales bacterium]
MNLLTASKKYISFFRIRFSAGLQYRAAALAGVVTQFVWGLMEIRMFEAFYRSNPGAFPMGRQALYSYVWLQQALLSMFMMWIFDNSIFEQISNGGVAVELCRPCDIYSMWFAKNCSMRLSASLMRCIPIFVVTAFFPAPFGIVLPSNVGTFLLFLLSLILGFMVVISMAMLVYISAFFTISPMGVRMVIATVAEFCSGAIVPLPFLPDGFRQAISFLPFASMQSTPFLIWGGTLVGSDAYFAIGLQLFWVLALIFIGKLLMRSALKKVVLQGG